MHVNNYVKVSAKNTMSQSVSLCTEILKLLIYLQNIIALGAAVFTC